MVIGGASPEGVAILELGVAPPDDSGTDLQDELLTPEESMVIGGASLKGVVILELGVAPPDASGMDLEDELLSILHRCLPSCHLSRSLLRHFWCLRPCIQSHRFLLNRTLFPVSSRGLFHSGKWSNVRLVPVVFDFSRSILL